ncbi:MAG: hypothetical protein GX957_16070 [Clostridiaceae bacterium]|nr:hypothetical protein [Clostridiaceae bacterium]
MYRIFCESLHNYLNSFKGSSEHYRMKIAYPLLLLTDVNKYKSAMAAKSNSYKQISDLLTYMKKNIDRYPKIKAFLWTLESRGMRGRNYGVSSLSLMEEQTKLVNMFLNLLYWEKQDIEEDKIV